MNKKKYSIISAIMVLLIMGFLLACGGTTREAETTEVVKELAKVKEEPEEETISDEVSKDAEYIAGLLVLDDMIVKTKDKSRTAMFDFAVGLASIEELKVRMSEYASDMNNCYDVYLDLEPSERFESAHAQMGEAMKHYLNSATYMEQLVETDDINKISTYMDQSTAEVRLGISYIKKSTAEISKLTEEVEEKVYISKQGFIDTTISDSIEKFSQTSTDFANKDISLAEYKTATQEFIRKINSCYDMYLELEPPKKYEKVYNLFGKAMDHYSSAATSLQEFIDTEDIEEMKVYIRQAAAEMDLGTGYIIKYAIELVGTIG